MTYNQTVNKLLILFRSITDARQVTMAKRYAYRLIARVEVGETCTECFDFSGWHKRDELIKQVDMWAEKLRTK